ncbi:MAG: putative transcriptional regulator [Candidatus Accumulibacter phosphatis]|uniref:Putative transcriptional regulator n=1 Tax=Candidatus Accumulibacter phosphatis TaxID=327160 RepID=A0A080LYH6_9PROT|nr:MAG: putative transcriptional regulator [Candidatus Accumulibacter phosphatis]HCZ13488.1 transcriptional regulator [Accumulibacter sp.]HRF10994.1 transcriptional regulator [Candidatus Accumulibacter phosphatis]
MAYPKTTPNESSLPVSLVEFDHLPDSALISVETLAGLQGCSANTIWRRAKAGALPPPIRVSSAQTRWRVGDVRAAMAKLLASEDLA